MALHSWNSVSRDQSLDEQPRGLRGYLRLPGKSPVAADCVVADAVIVEPVSTPKFPANREINREFGRIRPRRRFTVVSRQTNSMLCSRIPYANKQGFDLTEQGLSTQEQGILSAKIKINAG